MADYSGTSFFDHFDYYTDHDPTNGAVQYVDEATAVQSKYVGYVQNPNTKSTNALISVDHTSISAKRQSVRLSSKETFDLGTIMAIDLVHMPSGALGVWPAIWALGNQTGWPFSGEIDIVEVVHKSSENAMTLHTGPGCTVNPAPDLHQGDLDDPNCNAGSPQPATKGCSVKANPSRQAVSRGKTLATAGDAFYIQGGGVYVMAWTQDGIAVYLFDRAAMPWDLYGPAAHPDPSGWLTKPLAKFVPGTCNFAQAFAKMQIILNIDFCGDWAGDPKV